HVVGFVDVDIKKASRACFVWGGQAFSKLEDAFAVERIDVVSIAVSDEYHYATLTEVARFPVRLVFAEKPLTATLVHSEKILELYKQRSIPGIVNYSRRFVPDFSRIRQEIRNGCYGEYLTGTGYYGKGILHNGSHMIDLLRYLLGDIQVGQVISSMYDYYPNEPSVSAALILQGDKTFTIQHVNCRAFTIFEMDLLFERKRIRMIDGGFVIEEYKVQDNPVFTGYRNMVIKSTHRTAMDQAMSHAVQNIYDFLEFGNPCLCSFNDAFYVLQVCLLLSGDDRSEY
ncbi:MAG: Gfo/Idh/MocA family oxidoreductase, partial [Desulfosporosinus sp.]